MYPPDSVMLLGTLIPLLAIFLGGLLLLIPVAGLTLRFAVKPAPHALRPSDGSSFGQHRVRP